MSGGVIWPAPTECLVCTCAMARFARWAANGRSCPESRRSTQLHTSYIETVPYAYFRRLKWAPGAAICVIVGYVLRSRWRPDRNNHAPCQKPTRMRQARQRPALTHCHAFSFSLSSCKSHMTISHPSATHVHDPGRFRRAGQCRTHSVNPIPSSSFHRIHHDSQFVSHLVRMTWVYAGVPHHGYTVPPHTPAHVGERRAAALRQRRVTHLSGRPTPHRGAERVCATTA